MDGSVVNRKSHNKNTLSKIYAWETCINRQSESEGKQKVNGLEKSARLQFSYICKCMENR